MIFSNFISDISYEFVIDFIKYLLNCPHKKRFSIEFDDHFQLTFRFLFILLGLQFPESMISGEYFMEHTDNSI